MKRYGKLFPFVILLALFVFSLPVLLAARNRSTRNRNGYRHLTANRDGNSAGAAQTQTDKKPPTVAILLFDHVEIIDFAGPWEVFGGAGYKVFTVAEKLDPVNTVYGQKVVADYTFENSPKSGRATGAGWRHSRCRC
jgi:hypothetical protein